MQNLQQTQIPIQKRQTNTKELRKTCAHEWLLLLFLLKMPTWMLLLLLLVLRLLLQSIALQHFIF